MSAAPPYFTTPLFDLARIGPLGAGLILLFLAGGLIFFFLSFTARHGRSRWPLHALMALGIVAVGSGVAWGATAGISLIGFVANFSGSSAVNPSQQAQMAVASLIAPFWLGLVGALLGVLACIRAIIGLIREPGPRF